MYRTLIVLLVILLATPAFMTAQEDSSFNEPPTVVPLKLSGPRFGVTYLSPGIQDKVLEVTDESVAPFITQFGWQWEQRMYGDGGFTAVSEWVLLVGGLEQSLFLPSVSWLIGIRSAGGTEFGIGPNVTAAGAALAFAGGATIQSGPLFFPVNVAVVPSRSGLRLSLLGGFNMRQQK
jgi:hypothetical protein